MGLLVKVKRRKIGKQKPTKPHGGFSVPFRLKPCRGRRRKRVRDRKILEGEEASFSLPPLPLSHLHPSLLLPLKSSSMWRENKNRVHPVAAAPPGLGGAFWKVIPAHCSGLKCCHAELVPNCFAATPPPFTLSSQHHHHHLHPSSNIPATNKPCSVFKDVHVYKYMFFFYLVF